MENICEVGKLNSIRNEMTHLWGTACATFGGAVVLFLSSGADWINYVIATAGLIIAIIMANDYFVRRNEVIRILNKLEEK